VPTFFASRSCHELYIVTAPWCGHCKQLQPDWEAAAQKLDAGGAFLGWVDATAETELGSIYGVKGYPTIKLFPGGTGKSFSAAMDYNGGRSIADIVSAALAEVDKTGVPKEIPELASADVMKDECSGHNHICVLAALPHILDSGAEGRNSYKALISKVSKTFRGSAFSFLWFEGTSQPELEHALEYVLAIMRSGLLVFFVQFKFLMILSE
jgi:protein disulfide-isomerase A6